MNSAYLEVGIGLAVVFFVVSTMADAINEVVTRTLNTRAKALWATIHGLMEAEIGERPHVGVDFIGRAAVPSWLPIGDWNRDFRPVVGKVARDAEQAARDWIDRRIETLDQAGLNRLADEIARITGRTFRSISDATRAIGDLSYEQLLAVAGSLGVDVDVATLYPPLQVEETRRRLTVYLRHELDRDEVSTWAVAGPAPADLLAASLPLDAARHRLLVDAVPEAERYRLEGARPADVYRIALENKTPDERVRLVMDAAAGEGGEELTRRWMTATGQPTDSADALAGWLVAQPIGRQLTLLRRTTVTGRTADAAARTAELLAMASIEGLDYVRRNGARTKVWWIDGRAFGSAIWEAAKRYDPDPDGGPLDAGSSARIAAIAAEWEGTPLGNYLATTGVDHAEDVDRFVESVGAWFDGQMARLSMTYRRNVKWVLGAFGAVMALGFNVNAVALTDALLDDAAARQTLVSYAEALVDSCDLDAPDADGSDADAPTGDEDGQEADGGDGGGGDGDGGSSDEPEPDPCITSIEDRLDGISRLDDLGIPLVSDEWVLPFSEDWDLPIISDDKAQRGGGPGFWDGAGWVLGVLLTSIAVSAGGTFWFDFLKLLTGMRRRR